MAITHSFNNMYKHYVPGAVLDTAATAANTKPPPSRSSHSGRRDNKQTGKTIPAAINATGETGQGNGLEGDRVVGEAEQLQSR